MHILITEQIYVNFLLILLNICYLLAEHNKLEKGAICSDLMYQIQ